MKFTDWREGARHQCETDVCPSCGRAAPELVLDVQKYGKHRLVMCLACGWTVFDGEMLHPIR